LLHLGVAAKRGYFELDALLLEDLGLGADVGHREGKRIGDGLAELHLVERVRGRARTGGRHRYKEGLPSEVEHHRLFQFNAARGGTRRPDADTRSTLAAGRASINVRSSRTCTNRLETGKIRQRRIKAGTQPGPGPGRGRCGEYPASGPRSCS